MTAPRDSRVGVVVPTFRRPDQLSRVLTSLASTSDRAPVGWRLGVIVVDDDPAGSAAEVADRFDSSFPLGCTYVTSGAGNISVARNAGLEAAMTSPGEFDWIASVDDDVVVPAHWLATCSAAVTSGTHNAVTGPLLKDFSVGPRWLSEEPFDQIGILVGTDGEDAFVCATGNNWVNASFLRSNPTLRFDPALGRTGGEDMDFFYRAVAAGLRPVFSARAAVLEAEPRTRCTMRYQMRRAFWLGLLEGKVSLRLHLVSRPRLLARAARRAIERGSRQLPSEAVSRRGVRFQLVIIAQSAGLGLGCLGLTVRHK